MKKILLMLMCAFIVYKVQAQTEGEYMQRPKLSNFTGIWIYKNGAEEFKIILSKQKLEFNVMILGKMTKFYKDCIVGWHSYSKGGIVIQSSINNAGTTYKTADEAIDGCTLFGGVATDNNTLDYIQIWDFEDTRPAIGMLVIATDNRQANWSYQLEHMHGLINKKLKFGVPKKAVMTKQLWNDLPIKDI